MLVCGVRLWRPISLSLDESIYRPFTGTNASVLVALLIMYFLLCFSEKKEKTKCRRTKGHTRDLSTYAI